MTETADPSAPGATAGMRAGFAALVFGYVLSQFYRAFLAVLAPMLKQDLGATPEDLALASGLWFAVFAAMQIPVGHLLDGIGPRRTAGYLFILGGAGGAAAFATATSPLAIVLAMALIGIGCAPILMASIYIFARVYPPAMFASLAGLMIGIGSAGNLAAAAPLTWAADALGWRAAIWIVAAATLAVGLALLALIRDPAPAPPAEADGAGFLHLLTRPAFLLMVPLMAVSYGPAAGIRGLWAGPYFADVFGLGHGRIGVLTLWMAVAMVLGNFAYGPLDRLFGTRKWVIIGGNLAVALCLGLLALWPDGSVARSALLLAGVGFFGASYPMVLAHGRAFFPHHLAGRGVTIVNLMGIGGAGLLQIASGRLFAVLDGAPDAAPAAGYAAIFLFFAVLVLIGTVIYMLSQDRLD